MAKKKQDDLPSEVWLMVATDALARYVGAGGQVVVAIGDGGNLIITLDAGMDDLRLAESFTAMVADYHVAANGAH
jgi:hypothetical protein